VKALERAFKDPNESFVRTLMDIAGVEGKRTSKLLGEHRPYTSEAMNTFFDKKLLERVGFAEREDLVKVPPAETQPAPTVPEVPDDQPKAEDSSVVTTEAEMEVYDHVRHRLPFLIYRDEDLFRKLDHVYFKDFKGVFAVCYKRVW
jgi:hypothetical protein